MFTRAPKPVTPMLLSALSLAGRLVLTVLTTLLIVLGMYPAPLLQLIRSFAGSL